MKNDKFELSILPLFENDLNEIVDYISHELFNPSAASRLVNEIEQAIYKRLQYPIGYPLCPFSKELEHDYYVIRVRQYRIFYIVIDNIMEIHRILFYNRDFEQLL